jgi:citrate lyase subunit beta/citryl-CoA lyase
MKPYRSMLFVPGQMTSWVEKGIAAGADALILDLEDAVPADSKQEAREAVVQTIASLRDRETKCDLWVRPNSLDSGLMGVDLEAVVGPGLAGLFLPKIFTPLDVVRADALVTHFERRSGLAPESVRLIVALETASAMAQCEQIATASPRVGSLLGATGPDADVGRALGFEFTPEGLETLYLRSRVVLACRAAGLSHPLCGVWQDLHNIEGFRSFAEDNRQLGYRGILLIHPSHVAPANDVFTPSVETVELYRKLIAAFRGAEAKGSGAVDFQGQHVDLAHVKTAEDVIELAEAIRDR